MHFFKKKWHFCTLTSESVSKEEHNGKFTVLRRENPSWISLEFIANVQRSNTLFSYSLHFFLKGQSVTLALQNSSVSIIVRLFVRFELQIVRSVCQIFLKYCPFCHSLKIFHILKVQVSKWLTFKLENSWNRRVSFQNCSIF